jgi:hypothetical protein
VRREGALRAGLRSRVSIGEPWELPTPFRHVSTRTVPKNRESLTARSQTEVRVQVCCGISAWSIVRAMPRGLATTSAYLHSQGGALPIAALLFTGVLWSVGGVLIKLVPWPALAIWSLRSAIAAATLLAAQRGRFGWSGITRTEWGAALAYAATTALFIAANKYTTAANAILIQYSAPAWVALFGALWLSER